MIETIKKTKTNLDLFSKMKEEKLINIKDFQFLKQGPNTTANEIYLLESCTINNCSFFKKTLVSSRLQSFRVSIYRMSQNH